MSSPSDKHMESAKALLIEVEAMPSDGNAHIIAAALANAEREGMRRAAEIAREYGDFEPDCPHGEGFWRACDNLAAAILSEANSNSPDTLPVEADSASGAVCSSPASLATYSPWTVKNGFNPDKVR